MRQLVDAISSSHNRQLLFYYQLIICLLNCYMFIKKKSIKFLFRKFLLKDLTRIEHEFNSDHTLSYNKNLCPHPQKKIKKEHFFFLDL